VENKQFNLCLEVLRRFHKIGLLEHVILIGSWCTYFYRDYFEGGSYQFSLITRDIDFLIAHPSRLNQKVDLPELLKDLGFIPAFKGAEGYMKLDHPELILEFLVPEKGRGIDKPFPLPKLNMNAVTLRFLNFLSCNVIKVKVENFTVTLPHPANFALHKLIISQRRIKEDKAVKDRNAALGVLKTLIAMGRKDEIRSVFQSVPPGWQKKILDSLKGMQETEIMDFLKD